MRKYRKKEGVFMFNKNKKNKPTKEPQERQYQTQQERQYQTQQERQYQTQQERQYQTQEELERKFHMNNIAAIAKRRNVDMGVAYAMYNYRSIPCFTPDEKRKAFEEYFAQFK